MRRSLLELIDPSPNAAAQSEIWKFFGSACAYCGKRLQRKKKGAHLDHLLSSASSGTNHKSNRVLACATCNEAEKRDLDWLTFLEAKNSGNADVLLARREKIQAWQLKAERSDLADLTHRRLLAQAAAEAVAALYDQKVRELRALTEPTFAQGAV